MTAAFFALPRWAWMLIVEMGVVTLFACLTAWLENRARIRWKARADASRLVLLDFSKGVEQKLGKKKASRLAGRAEIETGQQVRDRLAGFEEAVEGEKP